MEENLRTWQIYQITIIQYIDYKKFEKIEILIGEYIMD